MKFTILVEASLLIITIYKGWMLQYTDISILSRIPDFYIVEMWTDDLNTMYTSLTLAADL